MKIKPITAILITLGIIILGIAVTSALGLYKTQSDKTPAKLNGSGYAEQNDPESIKGSYTFSDVSRLYNIPLDKLNIAFGLRADDPGTAKCSELSTVFPQSPVKMGPSSMRLFVAYYLGLPYTPTEESYLPDGASEILKAKGAMTAEQQSYLSAHTFSAAK